MGANYTSGSQTDFLMLVVCPSAMLNDWPKVDEALLKYHGRSRPQSAEILCAYKTVVTSYDIARAENAPNAKTSTLFEIKWDRIIFVNREHGEATLNACNTLEAKSNVAYDAKTQDQFMMLRLLRKMLKED
ncbi:hypothetical protein B0H14DRAFT_2753039 [Mycena olivaceomarginata]|nr:hypothetical protein B0H14DRAFT_2753039 [Mycena olivaceomarginata]